MAISGPLPVHHVMLGIDIANSSSPARDDSVRAGLHVAWASLVGEALGGCRLAPESYAVRERGDGGRYDFRPGTSPVLVIEAMVDVLPKRLRRYNKGRSEAHHIALRAVVHGGYVVARSDGTDADGAEVDLLHGMLDAQELRSALASSGATSVLAVSQEIWDGVARHDHGDVDSADFTRWDLTVKREKQVPAWLHVGRPAKDGQVGPGGSPAAGPSRHPRDGQDGPAVPGAGVTIIDSTVEVSNLAGRDQTFFK